MQVEGADQNPRGARVLSQVLSRYFPGLLPSPSMPNPTPLTARNQPGYALLIFAVRTNYSICLADDLFVGGTV